MKIHKKNPNDQTISICGRAFECLANWWWQVDCKFCLRRKGGDCVRSRVKNNGIVRELLRERDAYREVAKAKFQKMELMRGPRPIDAYMEDAFYKVIIP